MAKYTIGLDYGTNSVRALLVSVSVGREIATSTWTYAHGHEGVVLSRDPNLARQHPGDYLQGAEITIKAVLKSAGRKSKSFKPSDVIAIGVDTTGSTPIPVDSEGVALALKKRFANNPAAMAWLWKDHTSVAEAAEITALAKRLRPQYLAKCGGTYSSEWYFSKLLHCLRTSPRVFDAAYTWVELADWVPASLTGNEAPEKIRVGICAAGHKAMFNSDWGGYPDKAFLKKLDPKLAELRDRLPTEAYTIDKPAGRLTGEWAKRTGLSGGIPVAIGAFDAHLGAVGAGVGPGTLVKIIGTSTCDIMAHPASKPLADIPGMCGQVNGSVMAGAIGLEAGQSAVGDIFNWFVNYIQPGGETLGGHEALTTGAKKLKPGESGLIALDWNNGNRTILTDQRLTGLMLGQTLYTTPSEIYRALVEATAFGALTIINRLEEYGVQVRQIVNCGGIAEKNSMVMQIYADVTGRPMKISRSGQTCALGAAIAASVVAGRRAGGWSSVKTAQKAMTGLKARVFKPDPSAHKIYQELYVLYRQLHDAFGVDGWSGSCHNIMKQLLDIRSRVRK